MLTIWSLPTHEHRIDYILDLYLSFLFGANVNSLAFFILFIPIIIAGT